MKIFKLIFKLLLIIVFVFSVLLNVLLYSSSYNSLMVKYDEKLFYSLYSTSLNDLDKDALLLKKDYGLQFESNAVSGCSSYVEKYYFDNESKPTFSMECKQENQASTIVYFADNVLYVSIDGGTVTKRDTTIEEAISTNSSLVTVLSSLQISNDLILDDAATTKPHFSFSPFYFMGVRFMTEDTNSKYTYNYDLKGRLRSVVIENKDDDKDINNYSFNYKKEKITTSLVID